MDVEDFELISGFGDSRYGYGNGNGWGDMDPIWGGTDGHGFGIAAGYSNGDVQGFLMRSMNTYE
jgi:hypothetical protein